MWFGNPRNPFRDVLDYSISYVSETCFKILIFETCLYKDSDNDFMFCLSNNYSVEGYSFFDLFIVIFKGKHVKIFYLYFWKW